MLRLALEIPTAMLPRWTNPRYTDLDFILAHKVLADKDYADYFRTRPQGRELILDNSTHEFGRPLPMEDLRRAAELVKCDFIIAPDIVNEQMTEQQYFKNLDWLRRTYFGMNVRGAAIGGVLCGNTEESRLHYADCFDVYGGLLNGMLCFTFHHRDRLQWWHEYRGSRENVMMVKRIHVLGVSTLDEMVEWFHISEENPHCNFSIDTTKAVKWGVQLKHIDRLESLRGGPIDAKAVLELPDFTAEQIEVTEHNIQVLRNICTTGKRW